MKAKGLKILSSIICIAITAFTLSQYSKLIQHVLSMHYNWQFELLMVLGMLVFQYLFIHKYPLATKLNYFFKMLLISLLGSIMLWPLLFANQYIIFNDAVNINYFFLVVTTMFFIHKSIVAKMLLPIYLSYTYIIYRFIILLFII